MNVSVGLRVDGVTDLLDREGRGDRRGELAGGSHRSPARGRPARHRLHPWSSGPPRGGGAGGDRGDPLGWNSEGRGGFGGLGSEESTVAVGRGRRVPSPGPPAPVRRRPEPRRGPRAVLAGLEARAEGGPKGARDIVIGGERHENVPDYDLAGLAPGQSVAVPAIVEAASCTAIFGPGNVAEIDSVGDIIVEIQEV